MPLSLSPTLSPAPLTTTRPPKRRRGPQTSSPSKPVPILSPPRSKSTPEKPVKRRRTTERNPAAGDLRPPAFWNSLSHVPLAKSALAELNRRNEQSKTGLTGDSVSALETPSPQAGINLCRYARQGGPDISALRGFQPMPSSPGRRNKRGAIQKPGARRSSRGASRSGSRTTTGQTKSSSAYDAAFKQHLIDGKVWPINHYLETGLPDPPDNLDEIKQRICGGRTSLAPDVFTDEDYRSFHKAYSIAASEEAQSRTLDTIEGALSLSSLHIKRGPVKFGNLRPLLANNLVPGNPDRVWGARPEALDVSVRRNLEDLILPTTALDMICPNFVVHVKGPDGSLEVAKTQAVYDGALAARGMEALWAYGCDKDSQENRANQDRNQARTISCTFADGVLRLYSVYCRSRSPDRGPGEILLQQRPETWSTDIEYVPSLIASFQVHDIVDEFRQGAAAFRYALDWAREQRNEAIARANARASTGNRHDIRPP